MIKTMIKLLFGLCLIWCCMWVGTINSSEKPLTTKSDIEKFIQQLGNDDWQIRESAQKELIQLGNNLIFQYRKKQLEGKTTALENLKKEIANFARILIGSHQSADPEVKMRATQMQKYFYGLTNPKIVFVSGNNLCVMDTDGQNQRKLIESKSWTRISNPAWSPDGTMIIFDGGHYTCAPTGYSEICMVDADGKNLTELTEKMPYMGGATWSPDSSKITSVVSPKYNKKEFYIMDVSDKKQRRLLLEVNTNIVCSSPCWSPIGNKILFTLPGEYGSHNIYLIDTDGNNQVKLAEGVSSNWAPDGTKIAFTASEDKKIYLIDANGENKTRLTENKEGEWNSRWSPDGTKIAFCSERDIYVIGVNGKNQIRLTENADVTGEFSWSPDGTKIVFVSVVNPKRDQNGAISSYSATAIYVMAANGQNQKKLTKDEKLHRTPIWYPLGTEEIADLFRSKD